MLSVLSDYTNYNNPQLDERLLNYWENIIASGYITDDMVDIVTIEPYEVYKWIRDLRGLIKTKFKIPDVYIYPNIRINNLSNYDFKIDFERGKLPTKLKIIKGEILQDLYNDYLVKYKE